MSEKIDILIQEALKQTQLLERIFSKLEIENSHGQDQGQGQIIFLTTAQAAKAFAKSERTIRNWIKDGKLKAKKIIGDTSKSQYLVNKEDIKKIK